MTSPQPDETKDPQLSVATKYGELTLVFVDATQYPTNGAEWSRRNMADNKRHIARVFGVVTINRVPVRVSAYLYRGKECYSKGVELPEPIDKFYADYESTYNRRWNVERESTEMGDLPRGVLNKLQEIYDGEIRTAYESHPELQRAATRARLAMDVQNADGRVSAALESLRVANVARSDALSALSKFDREASQCGA